MIPIRKIVTILARRSTAEFSESEVRIRKAAFSSLGQAINKGTNILVTILSVPLMTAYLGGEYFGVAMAITGFGHWFLFDTGVAEGVKVRLIETFAAGNRRASQAYVSTGFFALLVVLVVCTGIFCLLFPIINWGVLFNVAPGPSHLHASILLIAAMVLTMIPLKILREIYTADQRGYVFSLWRTAATVASLGGIWLATRSDLGIPGILLGLHGPVVIATILCGLHLVWKDMPWLRPRISSVSMSAWRNMWAVSLGLFMFGIARMAINTSDIFIINFLQGGEEAAVYSLTIRLVLYVETVVSFLTYPAWPAIADAIQKRRKQWVWKATRAMFLLSFGFALPMCGLCVVFGKPIISAWSQGRVETTVGLVVVTTIYGMLRIWCNVVGTIVRALGRVSSLGIATFAEAILHVVLGCLLLQRMGPIGLALGSVISVALTRCWVLPLECYRGFREQPWDGSVERRCEASAGMCIEGA